MSLSIAATLSAAQATCRAVMPDLGRARLMSMSGCSSRLEITASCCPVMAWVRVRLMLRLRLRLGLRKMVKEMVRMRKMVMAWWRLRLRLGLREMVKEMVRMREMVMAWWRLGLRLPS